ncbi:hypothetical protein F975_01654 [Acinetobacter sp. ANC 3789]|uniref:DUF4238 domain-containing protein n=1 Tax=Acinetobacter sp. ANC 3789 TaxID=1217714 RepID=UPI0002CE5413|nr:DUF4238 domain-containing protein [Acinetobacter sp. ANC 3789]ENU80600.1 hypothetical protein F975_01654 [Acinetobacter sp. ANC 3789]
MILDKNWWFIGYVFGMNIGASFYISRTIDNHCLLINETQEGFITSDHPIINVHQSLSSKTVRVPEENEADFFYPISPKIAYMINKSDRFSKKINYVSLDFVKEMNKKMAENANKYIVSDDCNLIDIYKKHVGSRMKIIQEHSVYSPL